MDKIAAVRLRMSRPAGAERSQPDLFPSRKTFCYHNVRKCASRARFPCYSLVYWLPTPWPVNAPRVAELQLRPSMSFRTRAASLIALAAIVSTTACSDSLTAPTLAPEVTAKNGLLGDVLGGVVGTVVGTVNGLLTPAQALSRDTAVPQITRSFTFTRSGGKIEIPETGLRIDVPSDAIPGTTLTITVTALPGKSVAYDFQPHGTQFKKPLVFRQDLRGTSWAHSGFTGTLSGGYFKDKSQLNLLTGLGLLNELLPLTVRSWEATFNINHFSGYMVSSGRQSSFNDNEI